MMKDILGPALGGLVAGSVALAAGSLNRAPAAPAPAPAMMIEAPAAAVPMTPLAPRTATEPYVIRVVEAAPEAAPVTVVRTAPRATPAVYRSSDDDVVRYEPSARRVESKRSGAKTALIIAGSAGAGAGIGGLTGGKKGALIGAAIGGGAASIWEATKR